jgi:hypothetical protein
MTDTYALAPLPQQTPASWSYQADQGVAGARRRNGEPDRSAIGPAKAGRGGPGLRDCSLRSI